MSQKVGSSRAGRGRRAGGARAARGRGRGFRWQAMGGAAGGGVLGELPLPQNTVTIIPLVQREGWSESWG